MLLIQFLEAVGKQTENKTNTKLAWMYMSQVRHVMNPPRRLIDGN